jgi:hypothetical protein
VECHSSEVGKTSELSEGQISGLSNFGQRDDAASAYVLCPLNLSSSQFGMGS